MASAIDHEKHRDSSSLDGKVDGHGIHSEAINPLSDLPDPDAGLNEEERAAAVCSKLPHMLMCTINAGQDKKLLRRLDFKLIPWLSFLYLICRLWPHVCLALR
jgi:hypothetical protein